MDKSIEIYYDHYKDTFLYLRTYIQQRDKQFVYVVVLFAMLFFNTFSPSEFEQMSKLFLEKKIGIVQNNIQLIDSILLFLVFSFTIKYFQINLLIQKQYKYIHNIEAKLSEKLAEFEILRESKGYLNDYPLFSSIVHRIYTTLFPLLIIGLLIAKWINLLNKTENYNFFSSFSFNSLITLCIIILTFFYLIWIHFKDFKRKK